MNRDNDRQTSIILAVLGILPIVWLGLLIAPSVKGGLPEILPSLMNVMSDPFHIVLCEDSVKAVLVLLLCYGMGIGIYFSTRRNYRRREEHGSTKWGNAKAVDKKYRQNPPTENKLMTQAVRIGLNGKNHHQPIIGYRTVATTRALREKRSRSNYRGVKKYDNVYSGFWTEISTDRLNTVLDDLLEELKITKRQRIREIMKRPE